MKPFFCQTTKILIFRQALMIATIMLGAHIVSERPPSLVVIFLVAVMSLMLSARDIPLKP